MARRGNRDPATLPAAKFIRDYGLRLLGNADKAVVRFHDRDDSKALHDVRVALRRLRGWLRAFDGLLSLEPKQLHRLRRIAHSTNGARDAEISLEWLARLESGPELHNMPSTDAMARGLALIRDEQYRRVRHELPGTWKNLSARLRRSLRRRGTPDGGMPFMEAYGDALQRQARHLESAFEEARRKPDPEHIHRLRIAVKKTRYLLEAILPWRKEFASQVKQLTVLADQAGQIQDLQRFIELAEKVHLRQARARYRRLLERYMDAADDVILPPLDAHLSLLPLLSTCRAAAIRQANCLSKLRHRYLGRRRPLPVRELRRRLLGLQRDSTWR